MIENIIVSLLIDMFIVCGLIVIWSTICLIKCAFTHRNQMIILDAIYDYQMYQLDNGRLDHIDDVTFDDMEEWDTTQKRFWDWGYTRILPPEKFELIKPFIRHRK